MDIPSRSFLEDREHSTDLIEDRALRAEALCYDLMSLMMANMSIIRGALVLVRRENQTFVAELESELDAMGTRFDSIIAAIKKEVPPRE